MSTVNLSRRMLAECLGTFMLVFAGTGAIVINDLYGGVITHLGIALSFGLVVATVIYTYGDVSGAHVNPAVTIAFALAKRLPWTTVGPYIGAQLVGALLASLALKGLFPSHEGLGTTLPAGSALQSFIFEFILTWWLMAVILGVSTGAKEKGFIAGIVIGGVVALEALFAGPVCGASMNPARSIGPALVSGQLQHLWIYVLATTAGASFAVLSCRLIKGDDCCDAQHSPL